MSFADVLASICKQDRVVTALPIKVFLDPVGKTTQWACTHEISRRGVRLQGVQGISAVGQEIWVQRRNRRAKFRVVWIGKPGSDQAGQVGAECSEEEKCI